MVGGRKLFLTSTRPFST